MSRFETGMEGMVDIYVFETTGLLEQLDNILISTETGVLASEDVAEIQNYAHNKRLFGYDGTFRSCSACPFF